MWHRGVRTGIGGPVLAGTVALAIGFGGFGAWAALAPLEGAVIAPGTVTASGRNKVVQHLEGGIVKEILVKEGDRVSSGDPVMMLDATGAESMRNRLRAQLNMLEALEARAVAERDGAGAIRFPEGLVRQKTSPEVAKIIEDQEAEFRARLEKHDAELGILSQQIAARDEEIAGLQAQKEAVAIQLELIQEEKGDSEGLLKKGLTTKTKVMELRRAEAELIGQQGQLTAGIAKAKQAIAETEQEIERLKVARLEEAVARLSEVRLQRSDMLERMRTAQDALDRIMVRAPVSGTVINLTKYNRGAVITPGQEVMEIVPESADLIVEAHVRPQDIDDVRIGQAARLNFAALDQRQTPPVPGEVMHVSADRLENKRTGEVYYLARLKISSEPLPGFDPQKVGPGQPVDVFITTGERTFIAYLTEPITNTFRRALRES
jgi:HlyD family secretion protein